MQPRRYGMDLYLTHVVKWKKVRYRIILWWSHMCIHMHTPTVFALKIFSIKYPKWENMEARKDWCRKSLSGWLAKVNPWWIQPPKSRFPMACQICGGLVLINNNETQIKLMVVLPLMVPESLQSMVIQLKLGAPVLLGRQEIQLRSVWRTFCTLAEGSGRDQISSEAQEHLEVLTYHHYSTRASPNLHGPFGFTPLLFSRKKGLFGKDTTSLKHT